MSRRPVLALAAALVLIAAAAAAQPAGPWRALPWHLVDYHHKFPPTGIFRGLSIDMTLTGEVAAGTSLYLSPLWGKLDETGFYFGFVSQLSGPKGRSLVGKGLLFSRWGLASAADARAAEGMWAYIGDKRTSGEGDYVSVRRAFAWGQGRYTFTLSARPADGDAVWVDLRVREHRTGRLIDGGGLKFPGAVPRLGRTVVSFVEMFPPHGKGKWAFPVEIPRLDVAFSPALVNDAYGPVGHRIHYPRKVPRLVTARDDGFGLSVALGRIPAPQATNDNGAAPDRKAVGK